MPTLETADGKPVEVTPADAEAINAEFRQTMAGANAATEQELPRRAARGPATDGPPAARASRKRGEGAKSRTTTRPAAQPLSRDKRVEGLKGIAQVIAGVFAVGAKATGNAAFLADGLTVADHAGPGAEAVADMCDTDPRFAAAIDRICQVGPWSGLVAVGVSLGSQLARNHRPGMQLPGTVHPNELLERAAAAAA